MPWSYCYGGGCPLCLCWHIRIDICQVLMDRSCLDFTKLQAPSGILRVSSGMLFSRTWPEIISIEALAWQHRVKLFFGASYLRDCSQGQKVYMSCALPAVVLDAIRFTLVPCPELIASRSTGNVGFRIAGF